MNTERVEWRTNLQSYTDKLKAKMKDPRKDYFSTDPEENTRAWEDYTIKQRETLMARVDELLRDEEYDGPMAPYELLQVLKHMVGVHLEEASLIIKDVRGDIYKVSFEANDYGSAYIPNVVWEKVNWY